MIFITRRERFNAAHRLFRAEWSDARNAEIYGKCSNPNWHGHNYELFITVKGEIDKEIGYLVDLKQLSQIIHRLVIDKLDHKNLNLDVPFLQNRIVSTENIAMAIWEQLDEPIRETGAALHCVKVCETENNYVEYYGK